MDYRAGSWWNYGILVFALSMIITIDFDIYFGILLNMDWSKRLKNIHFSNYGEYLNEGKMDFMRY